MSQIVHTSNNKYGLSILPHNCPFCHRSITPNILYGYLNGAILEVFLHCPDNNCKKGFLAYYEVLQGNPRAQFLNRTTQGSIHAKIFSETINIISPNFALIYNQAFEAEQQNLFEICGVGYRKALEFLIKDYTIKLNPDNIVKIKNDLLGKVIENFVDDTRVKSVAKRAAWLGNDETHYVRKWEGQDLNDLKKLIELTVHWIEMEALTTSFENNMPS